MDWFVRTTFVGNAIYFEAGSILCDFWIWHYLTCSNYPIGKTNHDELLSNSDGPLLLCRLLLACWRSTSLAEAILEATSNVFHIPQYSIFNRRNLATISIAISMVQDGPSLHCSVELLHTSSAWCSSTLGLLWPFITSHLRGRITASGTLLPASCTQ